LEGEDGGRGGGGGGLSRQVRPWRRASGCCAPGPWAEDRIARRDGTGSGVGGDAGRLWGTVRSPGRRVPGIGGPAAPNRRCPHRAVFWLAPGGAALLPPTIRAHGDRGVAYPPRGHGSVHILVTPFGERRLRGEWSASGGRGRSEAPLASGGCVTAV